MSIEDAAMAAAERRGSWSEGGNAMQQTERSGIDKVLLRDSTLESPEEERQLEAAEESLRSTLAALSRAGAILGHTDRKGWWYAANRLWNDANGLAGILKEAREAVARA